MYRALKIGGVLIVVYLVGGHLTDWGKLLGSAGTAGTGVIQAFQGR